jgi:toxin YoeB
VKVLFTPEGRSDYLSWQETDPSVSRRINELIAGTRRTSFAGIGKPEPLRSGLAGWCSRRIDREHRLVYRVEGKDAAQTLIIAACRFHHAR